LIVIDYKKYALKMEGLLNYCKVLSKNEKVIVYEIQKVKY
jgi:hypothetical protein